MANDVLLNPAVTYYLIILSLFPPSFSFRLSGIALHSDTISARPLTEALGEQPLSLRLSMEYRAGEVSHYSYPMCLKCQNHRLK